MSSMIARVADAIANRDCDDNATYEHLARAAIVAMREPTEAMLSRPPTFGVAHVTEHRRQLWQQMIEEALK